MHQILNDILTSTRKRIRTIQDIETHKTLTTRSLSQSIRSIKDKHRIPVIAEVKPASPTTHNRDITPDEAAQIARSMEEAGAAAISVLTEPEFFHGSLEILQYVRRAVKIPVLRKDFIIDTKQLYEIHSDIILLIAAILGNRLSEFIHFARQRGLQSLVEVHNKSELHAALAVDAKIIGINNRNLKTMEIDLGITEELIPLIKDRSPDNIIISESGIMTPQDAVRVVQAGADAILVGSFIMKGDIYQNTKELVNGATYRG
jgi:indole-3-glycerol phosphate synthase